MTAQSDSTLPWFNAQDHNMHERDYPAGFASGILVEGSAAVQILYASEYTHLPDVVPAGPAKIFGVTEIVVDGILESVRGWWNIPSPNDPPPRYEPEGSGAAIYNVTKIESSTAFIEYANITNIYYNNQWWNLYTLISYLLTADDDTITSNGTINTATEAIRVDTAIAQEAFQIGPNNYLILIPGLNADQWDSHDWEDLPDEIERVSKLIFAASDEITLATGVDGRITIGVNIPAPLPTATPAVIHPGTGVSVRTPTPGGTPGWIIDSNIPTPEPTLKLTAGANISILEVGGERIFSATVAGASVHLQVIGGATEYTIDHKFGYQYPTIDFYIASTGQKIHLVDVYCNDINYATAIFGAVLPSDYAIAVCAAGSGVGSGSMVININQEAATPLPTLVVTGSGAAEITPIAGGYNIDVDTPDPTWTSTPTRTATPIPTSTPTPSPVKVNTDIGDYVSEDFLIYTAFLGPGLAQGVINSSSQIIDLAYRNVSDNEIAIAVPAPVPLNYFHVVTSQADEWQYFGDSGSMSFSLDPGTENNAFALCDVMQVVGQRWNISPVEIQYASNGQVNVEFSSPPGLMQANFLIAEGTQAVGNGSATSFLIDTGKDHREIIVQVFETGGDRRRVFWNDIVLSSTHEITVSFPVAPTTNQFTVAWADAQQVNTADGDLKYWALNGWNRHLGRGDQFNEKVPVWAKQIKAGGAFQIITGLISSANNIELYNSSGKWADIGYNVNNYLRLATGKYFGINIGSLWLFTVEEDEIGLHTNVYITGSANVTKDVTAAGKYYGDTVDVGYGLNKSQSGTGRTLLAQNTPTPTPYHTPTPTPTWGAISRFGEVEGAITSGLEWYIDEGKLLDLDVVEATIFRHKVVTIETKSGLLTLLHQGDSCLWLPGGNLLAKADLQILKAMDTGEYFAKITYNAYAGSKAGTSEFSKLIPYDERDPQRHYLKVYEYDDEIHLMEYWVKS